MFCVLECSLQYKTSSSISLGSGRGLNETGVVVYIADIDICKFLILHWWMEALICLRLLELTDNNFVKAVGWDGYSIAPLDEEHIDQFVNSLQVIFSYIE